MNWIEKSRKRHGDRYDYSLAVYKNALTKVEILCPIHGSFWQTPASHYSNGSGCPACAGRPHMNTESFIARSTNIHGDRYDYSKVKYLNNKTPVIIICPVHGEFKQTPAAHIQKRRGCNKCNGSFYEKKTNADFLLDASSIHGDRYDYSRVEYDGAFESITIVCPKHGEFQQLAKEHLRGYGCRYCANLVSQPEIDIKDYIETLGFEVNSHDRVIIAPFELDLVIEEANIAIEYCGLHWHNEEAGKDKNYHYEKYKRCKDIGYELITIFEDEWLNRSDAVRSVLKYKLGKSPSGFGARLLKIGEISSSDAEGFLNQHHLIGSNPGTVRLGAFFGNELIAVMVFGKPTRQTSNYQWELIRFATDGRSHPGVADKLFKTFVRQYQPKNIVSFSDHRWFTGGLYGGLGFQHNAEIPPDYQYIKGKNRYHKSSKRRQRLLLELNIPDEGQTERELSATLGYKRIWDCGKTRWVWNNG